MVSRSSREAKERSASFEPDFNECWQHYPRKVARKAALRAYIAQRRKAVPAEVLLAATQHYAEAMRSEGRASDLILYGSTFFGPDDRWEDYKDPPKAKNPYDTPRQRYR